MIFWRFFCWLFKRRPKELKPFDEALLLSFQKEKEDYRKRQKIRDKEVLKQRQKREKEEQKKHEKIKKLEMDGVKQVYIERAFNFIGRSLVWNDGANINISYENLKMTEDQFAHFKKSFAKLCYQIGLDICGEHHNYISISWKSAVAYKDKLEKETTKSITTSAYR
jgi:hypothetical protein